MTDATDRRGITPDRTEQGPLGINPDAPSEAEVNQWFNDQLTANITGPDYDTVVGQVGASLAAIRNRLKLLREQKERTRVEIKQLVTQEHMLKRMAKIAAKDQADGE